MLLIVYSIAMIFVTAVVHVGFSMLVLEWLRSVSGSDWALRNAIRRASVLGGLVMLLALASFVESALWAFLYLAVGAMSELGPSLYFSLVTFTSLGYGDIVLSGHWRILAAFEAVNGVIIFGWSTAIIVAVSHRLYLQRIGDDERP